jgi:hypothetical protein
MKKIVVVFAALAFSAAAYAQHNGTDMQTKSADNKAMLDGKAFVVTLSDNTSGTLGKTGSMQSGTVAQPDRTDQGTDKNAVKPEARVNDTKTGKKMVIHFENGMVRTSAKGDLKIEKCAYNSWGMESTGISFSADCNSSGTSMNNDKNYNSGTAAESGRSSTTVSGTADATTGSANGSSSATGADQTSSTSRGTGNQLTGTVNGDTIHGVLTCTKNDGTVKSYSYTGTTAGKNDLDMENEMGMK